MPHSNPITIKVTNGKISCTPRGGHIRAKHRAQLAWQCDEGFTLAFTLLDGSDAPAWPFREPRPAGKITSFTGTLNDLGPDDEAPAYKYSVTIGNQTLDPIIIVDK